MECLEYSSPSSIFANDQAVKWARAKVCVYAESVVCVGQVKDIPGATERWKGQVEELKMSSSYQDAVGPDGEANEFEWKNFKGFSSLSFLREIQKDLETKNIHPQDFKDRIIFMSMFFNDIEWKKNDENCISNAERSQELRDEILARTLDVSGSRVGREMVWRFSRSKRAIELHSQQNGTSIQRNWSSCLQKTSALGRGILMQKKGRCTIHFGGDSMNTKLLFQTVHSVNQLSVYGAVASWCYQVA